MLKPLLYLHVGRATHFLSWELPVWRKYFTITSVPSMNVPLLSFGPDVLEEASILPASIRYAVMFPGFSHNPLHNLETRKLHKQLIRKYFKRVFINYGPLETAYKGLNNVAFYPFSVDTSIVKLRRYRTRLDSLIHISNDGPQKDWPRSEEIMLKTKLPYEVYPPRDAKVYERHVQVHKRINKLRKAIGLKEKFFLPYGYVDHKLVVKKYQEYDGFVHVARDIGHPLLLDGKYTASLIEAGLTGAILFWHDTYGLGNNLETVIELPLDTEEAAKQILETRSWLNIKEHSKKTREEMLATFNPEISVGVRAKSILADL